VLFAVAELLFTWLCLVALPGAETDIRASQHLLPGPKS